MMKIAVDRSSCAGHALCHSQSAELFVLDDGGYIGLDGVHEVPVGLEAVARRGAAACPERVITVVED